MNTAKTFVTQPSLAPLSEYVELLRRMGIRYFNAQWTPRAAVGEEHHGNQRWASLTLLRFEWHNCLANGDTRALGLRVK